MGVPEWESLNAKAEVARVHRHGHCHEAMMLYVHHLPESKKTPKMCESNGTSSPTLEESYRRATTQGPIRFWVFDSDLPGCQPKEKEALTAKAGYDCLNNATVPRRPEAVGWAPLVGQAR